MTTMRTFLKALLLPALTILGALPAMAQAPRHMGLGLQEPASAQMERIFDFHHFMIWVIVAISVFVLLLLLWVIVRYNKRMNPTPSNVSHNVFVEVIWTVVPVVILIVISLQSMPLLYYIDRVEEPEMTLKVTGYQWYWGYEYPDQEGINFLAYPVADGDIGAGQLRNLSTDVPVVLPVEKNIQIITTAADVLHSWTVPAFGVKMDTVPGRLNETWVRITKPGVYYGQCSELCGKNHAFMPVEVHAVTQEQFEAWVAASVAAGQPAPSPISAAARSEALSRFAMTKDQRVEDTIE